MCPLANHHRQRVHFARAFYRAALTPSAPLALMPPPPSGANQPVSVSRLQMQLHLQGLQQNTNALRKQLSQLRNMQVDAVFFFFSFPLLRHHSVHN